MYKILKNSVYAFTLFICINCNAEMSEFEMQRALNNSQLTSHKEISKPKAPTALSNSLPRLHKDMSEFEMQRVSSTLSVLKREDKIVKKQVTNRNRGLESFWGSSGVFCTKEVLS